MFLGGKSLLLVLLLLSSNAKFPCEETSQVSLIDVKKSRVDVDYSGEGVSVITSKLKNGVFIALHRENKGDSRTYIGFHYSTDYCNTFNVLNSLKNNAKAENIDFFEVLPNGAIFLSSTTRKSIYLLHDNVGQFEEKSLNFDYKVLRVKQSPFDQKMIAIHYEKRKNEYGLCVVTEDSEALTYDAAVDPISITWIKGKIDGASTDDSEALYLLVATKDSSMGTEGYNLVIVTKNGDVRNQMSITGFTFWDNNYFFATKIEESKKMLYYSKSGINFIKCEVPDKLIPEGFKIVNVNQHKEIYVIITQNDNDSLYVTTDGSHCRFTKILESVASDNGCIQLSFPSGVDGTILATLKSPQKINDQPFQSVYSVSGGHIWDRIFFPKEDIKRRFSECENANCYPKLKFKCNDEEVSRRNKKPWLLVAQGSIVIETNEPNEVDGLMFVSHTGGVDWMIITGWDPMVVISDVASLLVSFTTLSTANVSVSNDEGISWNSIQFELKSTTIEIEGVYECSGDLAPKLMIVSQAISESPGKFSFHTLDFTEIIGQECGPSDIDNYSPYLEEHHRCFRGQAYFYARKKLGRMCTISQNSSSRKIINTTCSCSVYDFTCEFGYKASLSGECIPDPDHNAVTTKCNLKNRGALIPSGFRLLDHDKCTAKGISDADEISTYYRFCGLEENSEIFFSVLGPIVTFTKLSHILNGELKLESFFRVQLKCEEFQFNIKKGWMFCLADKKIKKSHSITWDTSQTILKTKVTTISQVEVDVKSFRYDRRTSNLYVLTIEGSLLVYNLRKNIKKRLTTTNLKLDSFEIHPVDGVIVFKYDENGSSKLAGINNEPTKFLTYDSIKCIDFYGIHHNESGGDFFVYCKETNELTIYKINGTLVKNIKLVIPKNTFKIFIIRDSIFTGTPNGLFSSTNFLDFKCVMPDFVTSLFYHSNIEQPRESACLKKSCDQFCFPFYKQGCDCIDGFSPSVISDTHIGCVPDNPKDACLDHQLSCRNGFCVDKTLECNGHDDCGDNTDESGCSTDCSPGMIKCFSGDVCIESHKWCDGSKDCPDGSDESCNSSLKFCEKVEFDCLNGECVAFEKICDNKNDCSNGFDEEECPYHCKNQMFQCKNNQCIDEWLMCDGNSDCLDGSDEAHCPSLLKRNIGTIVGCLIIGGLVIGTMVLIYKKRFFKPRLRYKSIEVFSLHSY